MTNFGKGCRESRRRFEYNEHAASFAKDSTPSCYSRESEHHSTLKEYRRRSFEIVLASKRIGGAVLAYGGRERYGDEPRWKLSRWTYPRYRVSYLCPRKLHNPHSVVSACRRHLTGVRNSRVIVRNPRQTSDRFEESQKFHDRRFLSVDRNPSS